jgi:hypothetical protein
VKEGTHAIDEPLSSDVESDGSERVEPVLARPDAVAGHLLERDDELLHLALHSRKIKPTSGVSGRSREREESKGDERRSSRRA